MLSLLVRPVCVCSSQMKLPTKQARHKRQGSHSSAAFKEALSVMLASAPYSIDYYTSAGT